MQKLFQGTYTAVITPFDSNDRIDWGKFEAIIEQQIAGKVEGIVFVGTTGESPTLSHEEHNEVLRRSVTMVKGRCKVIHGTGSNSTDETLQLARVAAESGADGQLVVAPYYNKPSQEGLYKHYIKIANETDVPIILYNIKGRTGINVETSTLLRLSEHKNIVGVKEASGDINQMMDVIRATPENFSVLVGDDMLVLPFMSLGGDGVISVMSNCIPQVMSEMVRTCLRGDLASARTTFYSLLDSMRTLFIDSNPVPVKEMMSLLGFCEPDVRLPLCRASEKSMVEIKKTVEFLKSL